QPRREQDREKSDGARDQPMSVLVQNPADPFGGREGEHVPSVRRWPVRHRQTGARAGDETAREKQENREGGDEVGKTVKHFRREPTRGRGGQGRRSWQDGPRIEVPCSCPSCLPDLPCLY